jgi:hypothetical protein
MPGVPRFSQKTKTIAGLVAWLVWATLVLAANYQPAWRFILGKSLIDVLASILHNPMLRLGLILVGMSVFLWEGLYLSRMVRRRGKQIVDPICRRRILTLGLILFGFLVFVAGWIVSREHLPAAREGVRAVGVGRARRLAAGKHCPGAAHRWLEIRLCSRTVSARTGAAGPGSLAHSAI